MGNSESNSSRFSQKKSKSKYLAYNITEVLENSPGQRAGLNDNDYILKINGRKLSQLKEEKILNFVKKSTGKSFKLLVFSPINGRQREVILTTNESYDTSKGIVGVKIRKKILEVEEGLLKFDGIYRDSCSTPLAIDTPSFFSGPTEPSPIRYSVTEATLMNQPPQSISRSVFSTHDLSKKIRETPQKLSSESTESDFFNISPLTSSSPFDSNRGSYAFQFRDSPLDLKSDLIIKEKNEIYFKNGEDESDDSFFDDKCLVTESDSDMEVKKKNKSNNSISEEENMNSDNDSYVELFSRQARRKKEVLSKMYPLKYANKSNESSKQVADHVSSDSDPPDIGSDSFSDSEPIDFSKRDLPPIPKNAKRRGLRIFQE